MRKMCFRVWGIGVGAVKDSSGRGGLASSTHSEQLEVGKMKFHYNNFKPGGFLEVAMPYDGLDIRNNNFSGPVRFYYRNLHRKIVVNAQ